MTSEGSGAPAPVSSRPFKFRPWLMSGVLDLNYRPWDYVGSPPASQVVLLDTIRDMSGMNAKNYEYTDRSGHVQGVLVDITIKASRIMNASVVGIPNSWKMRNAFRKFHFYRESMFRRAGVTKKEMGKYGQTIRPYADLCHAQNGSLHYNTGHNQPYVVTSACPDPSFIDTMIDGGGWSRTTLVAADPDPTVNVGVVDSADQWTIHICDEHDVANAPWGSVGMVQAYIQDREKVVTPDATETIDANNPLSLLSSQSVTGGDVAEVASEQEEIAPPYDIADTGDAIRKIEYGVMRLLPYENSGGTNIGVATLRNVFLPAGFLFLDFDVAGATIAASDLEIQVDVRGVFDCRDWTE